jgi:signal transduction histidine kinase
MNDRGRAAPEQLAADERLFALFDRMLGNVELPAVLQDVAAAVCTGTHAERASIYLVDKATEELDAVAVVGNVARMIRVPIAPTSLAGYCASSGRAFVVPDAYGDLSGIDPHVQFDARWDAINQFRTRDVLCAPALFKGEVMGVVQAINSRSAPFTNDDLPWLCTVSRLVGYALHHARLYDDLATLKEVEKRKAQFMQVMIHELKSPVAGAKMLADAILCNEENTNTPEARMTKRISQRMTKLLNLIEDLLQLARVKSGEALGEVAVLDVGAYAAQANDAYRDQASQKGLELSLEIPADPVRTRFDRKGLELVLSNLVSNAVKYTSSGIVRVRVEAVASWAVIAVTDSGIGIPESEISRLFSEFFRASNARNAGIEGSGVGLAGTKNIVERFGGELALESRENAGSTFTVRLPLFEG